MCEHRQAWPQKHMGPPVTETNWRRVPPFLKPVVCQAVIHSFHLKSSNTFFFFAASVVSRAMFSGKCLQQDAGEAWQQALGENIFPPGLPRVWPSTGRCVSARPYHFSGPVVFEIHSHVNFAGFFASAHFVFILSFPPVRKINT